MSRSTRTRPSRSFRPSMLGARLEPIVVLDAAFIAALVTDAMDAKQQLKEDLAAYNQDLIIYNQDVTNWKLDKISLQNEISGLRAEVKDFNDRYHPKFFVVKGSAGTLTPGVTVEADLTGVVNSMLGSATADRDALQNKADQLDLEAKALKGRLPGLALTKAGLIARKMLIDQQAAALQDKECGAQMAEMDENVAVTDFGDSELDDLIGWSNSTEDILADTFDIEDIFEDFDDEYSEPPAG